MKYLAIDYGRKKIGLAISDGILAEPYKVIRVSSQTESLEKLSEIIKSEQVEEIVVGVSEGEMGKEQEEFAKKLTHLVKNIHLQDETLSTYDANTYSQSSGMNRKKRKQKEDAFAAAVMLQSFLDSSLQK